jgi:hypothetical protein
VTTQNHSSFRKWGLRFALLVGALGAWAGCEPQAPTCAQSSCLTLSLHAPLGQSLTAADVIVRDGDTLEKKSFWGAELSAPLVLSAPVGRVDSTRRAIYVRAISEDGGGRHSLTGQFEGTAASSSVDVALTTHCASCRPSARHGAAMTYEPLTRTVLVHGGMGTAGVPLDDLWAWNGLYWNQLATGPGPVARSGHVMAHDPQTGMVLLAFGQGPNETLDDTWLLDPKTLRWQKVAGVGPDARRHAALSPSTGGASRGLLLFGGQTASGQLLGDTWLWDGAAWQAGPSSLCDSRPLVPGTLPRCRMGATLVPSAAGSRTLLYGGLVAASADNLATYDDSVWQFVDGNWSVATSGMPAFVLGRSSHAAALLFHRGQPSEVWLGLGDSPVGLRQDSYLVQDATPPQPIIGDAPSPRRGAATAFDAEREELLIFGGEGAGGALGDTLTFSAETGFVRRD